MNLLPYPVFIYVNYLVFLVVTIGGWVVSPQSTVVNVFLSVAGVAGLAVLFLSKGKQLPPISLVPARIVQLLVFLLAILLAFCHYFLPIDNGLLILLVLAAAAATLLSLIFVNTESKIDN